MLAKLTSKNESTLPKAVLDAVGSAVYFDVSAEDGRIVLVPVRITRADAVRNKLRELGVTDADVEPAVDWARKS